MEGTSEQTEGTMEYVDDDVELLMGLPVDERNCRSHRAHRCDFRKHSAKSRSYAAGVV